MRSYISKLKNVPEISAALVNPSGFVVRKVSKPEADIVRKSGYSVVKGKAIINVGFKSRLKIDAKNGVRIFSETGKTVKFLQNPLDYILGDKPIKLKQGEKIIVYCGSKSSAYSSVEEFELAMERYGEDFEDILTEERDDAIRLYIVSGKMQSIFNPEALKESRAAAKKFNAKNGVRK